MLPLSLIDMLNNKRKFPNPRVWERHVAEGLGRLDFF
jgi:hypothetical protein